MSEMNTVIFDLDGTLLDTLEDLADGVNYTLRKSGYPEKSLEEVRLSVGNGLKNLIGLSVPGGVDDPQFEACLHLFKEFYSKNMRNKTRPYEGVMELLDALKESDYKMAIVSNKFDTAVKELSQEYFGQWITVAIGESANMKKKPAPDSVFAALRELDAIPQEAIYVGDSGADIVTAKNAGMLSVGVSWGFRSKDILIEAGADYIIDSPMDLLDVLEKIEKVQN